MKNQIRIRLLTGLTMGAAALAAPALSEEPVTFDRLSNQEPANWLTVYGNYAGWRYSALEEINRENVSGLRLAFTVPIAMTPGLAGANYAVPLVDDGFLYTLDGNNAVVKIDLSSGERGKYLWTTELSPPEVGPGRLQGIALWGNSVIANTRDGHVIALDRASGEVLWDKTVGVANESFNSAPIALEDKIIVSNGNGDGGTRGWIAALDATSGEELWRFHTIPGPGEPGHETWPQDTDAWMTGGGAIWISPTYDVATNTIITGTGNPVPAFDPEFRPGDNLYSNSSVALDADTGEMKWHFQYIPNDYQDHDAIAINQLFDVDLGGESRKILGHINRTGYFYTLDRNNGQFLGAQQVQTNVTWTSGIDPKTGKPIEYDPSSALQDYGNPVRRGESVDNCGGIFITGSWQAAFDPGRQTVYNTYINSNCWTDVEPTFDANRSAEERFGDIGLGATFRITSDDFRISAINVANSTMETAELPAFAQSGVLATAGDLIFFGDSLGKLSARDSDTLDELWSIDVGSAMRSPPITFEVDGKQFIAIQSGGRGGFAGLHAAEAPPNSAMLWVFAL